MTPTIRTIQDTIEDLAQADIVAFYKVYDARLGAEPVITAGVLADDWSANYPADAFGYMTQKDLRLEIQKALARLATAGKLKVSVAMKGGREVRAYEPAIR